jgi:hypothetical protein
MAGCDKPRYARGWCIKHWTRWWRYGDPNILTRVTAEMTAEERLRHYGWTVTEPGCWEWNGYRDIHGYGVVGSGKGAQVKAHRLSYETWVGAIPEGLLIRHACDNRPCMNPAHLSVGTHQDNSDDATSRGRHASGERNPRVKLTAEDVGTIRSIGDSVPRVELAKRFGVHPSAISRIVRNQRRTKEEA